MAVVIHLPHPHQVEMAKKGTGIQLIRPSFKPLSLEMSTGSKALSIDSLSVQAILYF